MTETLGSTSRTVWLETRHKACVVLIVASDVLQGPPIMKLLLACKKTHAEVLDVMFGDYRLCLVSFKNLSRETHNQ